MTRFHPESPDLAPGDLAKLRFMAELRNQLQNRLSKGNRALYDTRLARPGDEDLDAEQAPRRREALKAEMEQEPYFQAWSSMMRSSQDLTWRLVGQAVERDLPRLETKLQSGEAELGSLELDDGLETPPYLLAADTHRMPGSYFRQDGPFDVRAGALYDLGSAMYQFGRGDQSGRLLNDGRGRTTVAHLRRYYPELAPDRILDLGCSVGQNVLPLCDAYPAARVEAIDVGAPMLRYGHVRAQGLGRTVHFSQRNAEATGFPDRELRPGHLPDPAARDLAAGLGQHPARELAPAEAGRGRGPPGGADPAGPAGRLRPVPAHLGAVLQRGGQHARDRRRGPRGRDAAGRLPGRARGLPGLSPRRAIPSLRA